MKKIDYTEIGKKIRHCRINHGFSQEQLAEKCGISTAFLGHIERGTRAMSLETLITLCSTLHLSTDYLLMDELPDTDATVMSILNEVKNNGPLQYEKYISIIKALALISDKL